jgi:hypothetical protein
MELPSWGRPPHLRAWRKWLNQQEGRADYVGSFARCAREDAKFPANPAMAIPYLASLFVDSATLRAARQALREYLAQVDREFEGDLQQLRDLGRDSAVIEAAREAVAESRSIMRRAFEEQGLQP